MKIISMDPKLMRQIPEKTKKKAMKHALRRAEKTGKDTVSHSGAIPSLELFQKENCPYSHSVRHKLTLLGMDFISHSVPDGHARKHEELSRVGGKDQIPFLIDRRSGTKLYGSDPIISYLEKEYGAPAAGPLGQAAKILDARVKARVGQLNWAIRTPLEKFRLLADDITDGWRTVQHSYRAVRKVVMAPLTDKELKKAA